MINYYAVLGLGLNASDEEIKAAYRQNAKRYHPDLNPGNENFRERFLEIKNAYEILGNEINKKKYDDEVAAYRKAKLAKQQAEQSRQQAATVQPSQPGQAPQSASVKNSAAAAQQGSPVSPVNTDAAKSSAQTKPLSTKIDELKKMHSLQLELLRVASKENMLKYRKRLQEQLDSYKKDLDSAREKEKLHHKAVVDKMFEKMREYRSAQKKNSFNSGYQKGMKSAQESSKKTIEELKSLLTQTNIPNRDTKDGGGKKIQNLQMELSLINEKNRELEQQIELLERVSKSGGSTNGSDDGLKLQLDQSAVQIDELTAECDRLKNLVLRMENEAEILNEEILYLEGFMGIWQEVSADSTITSEEYEIIEQYEGARNKAKGTLYGALGLYVNALPDEITAAYNRLKKRYEGKDSHFNRYMTVLEAYNTLSDPAKKRAYDATINNEAEI